MAQETIMATDQNMEPRRDQDDNVQEILGNVPNVSRTSIFDGGVNSYEIGPFAESGLSGWHHVNVLIDKVREPLKKHSMRVQLLLKKH